MNLRWLCLAVLAASSAACQESDGDGSAAQASSTVGGGAGGGGQPSTANSTSGSATVTVGTSGAPASGTGGAVTSGNPMGGSAGNSAGSGGMLSEQYPNDEGIGADERVLFHDDFEQGWGRWDSPQQDTEHLFVETDASQANAGTGYLRSTVTRADLELDEYISSASRFEFAERVERVHWRFYAWFDDIAPNPHHWVRVSAGTANYQSSGLANTVPSGDDGFWFDVDANNDDIFNFYVYWYQMRSGRCNDGSAVQDCEGDQGTTYYYGNVFRPQPQTPFPRNAWTCIEIGAKANTLESSDGELSLWVNDELVGEYRPGVPTGTWLRAQFHTDGCDFAACTEPMPFEGFNFRSSADVRFKAIVLDAYYERASSAAKKAELEARGLSVSDTQTILYDDVVVGTERIGCRVSN